MKRVKSIDLLRGFALFWMFMGHILDWWLKDQYRWIWVWSLNIIDIVGAPAFLFVAGVSTMISFRKRIKSAKKKEDYHHKIIKKEYFTRASLIFIISIIYNLFIAIFTGDLSFLWTWFILQTIAISLFLSWPLLNISKVSRACIATGVFLIHVIILPILLNYKQDSTIIQIIYHVLYFSRDLDPILPTLPFFIIGTILGDVIFDMYHIDNKEEHRRMIKKHLIIPGYIFGAILVSVGIIYKFPNFLINRTISWYIYALGMNIIILSTLIVLEELGYFKTKKSYNFLFYFSYFSLTVFLAHNIMYFFFLNQLNPINVWFFILGTFIIWGIILRFLYKRFGHKISLKYLISQIAKRMAYLNEE